MFNLFNLDPAVVESGARSDEESVVLHDVDECQGLSSPSADCGKSTGSGERRVYRFMNVADNERLWIVGAEKVIAEKCVKQGARLCGCGFCGCRYAILVARNCLDGLMIGAIVKNLESMFVDCFLSDRSIDFPESISPVVELLVDDVRARPAQRAFVPFLTV